MFDLSSYYQASKRYVELSIAYKPLVNPGSYAVTVIPVPYYLLHRISKRSSKQMSMSVSGVGTQGDPFTAIHFLMFCPPI
jgi:hypothetical protein